MLLVRAGVKQATTADVAKKDTYFGQFGRNSGENRLVIRPSCLLRNCFNLMIFEKESEIRVPL